MERKRDIETNDLPMKKSNPLNETVTYEQSMKYQLLATALNCSMTKWNGS